MVDVVLPELPGGGARVLRWLREPGMQVSAGEPLLVVLTDLVEVVLPAPTAGALAEVAVAAGDAAAPGTLLARIRAEATPARAAPRVAATPLARRIAAALGLDLHAVAGSGPRGRVGKADVLRAAGSRQPVVGSRQAVGGDEGLSALSPQPLALSPQPSVLPYALAVVQVDMAAVAAHRAAQQEVYARRGLALSDLTCVAAAAAAALPRHPLLNARWSDAGIVLRRRIHLRIGDRLVRDAGDLTLRGLARALQDGHSPGGADDTTFVLVAVEGTALLAPAWSAPGLGAVLGVGAARLQPVAAGERIVVRPALLLSLAYDARILTFAHAGAFLGAVRRFLETLPAG